MSSSETRRSDTEDDDELIIRGELHASSVPELLRSLLRSNETGILTFRRDEVTKRLFIHDGQVVYAVSTNPEERLGDSLMLRGKLSARQYLEASKRVRPGQRLGTILVEMGALEAEDLVPAVEAQVRELLMDLLGPLRSSAYLAVKRSEAAHFAHSTDPYYECYEHFTKL